MNSLSYPQAENQWNSLSTGTFFLWRIFFHVVSSTKGKLVGNRQYFDLRNYERVSCYKIRNLKPFKHSRWEIFYGGKN